MLYICNHHHHHLIDVSFKNTAKKARGKGEQSKRSATFHFHCAGTYHNNIFWEIANYTTQHFEKLQQCNPCTFVM